MVILRWRAHCRFVVLIISTCFLSHSIGLVGLQSDHDDPLHWSLAQWVTWRDGQIAYILTPTFDAKGKRILSREEVILRCVGAYRTLESALNKQGFMEQDDERTRALKNFVRFVVAQSRMAIFNKEGVYTHALGYPITDQDYWYRASHELGFPPLLKSHQFLKYLANPTTYKLAFDLIESANRSLPSDQKWLVLFYRSRFLKSADTASYGRMLVLVPNIPAKDGSSIDKWIQFSISPPGKLFTKETKSVSMVVVRRNSTEVGASRAFICDFMRVKDASSDLIDIVPTMLLRKNPSKNCSDCHKAPVLPIHPRKEYGFDSSGLLDASTGDTPSVLSSLNARIMSYDSPQLVDVDPDDYGPTLGDIPDTLKIEVVERAAQSYMLQPQAVRRISDAARCGACHKGGAKINYPVSVLTNIGFLNFEEKLGLAETYVKQGWMQQIIA